MNTIPNPSEVMVVGLGYNERGFVTTITPIYIRESNGGKIQLLKPSTTKKVSQTEYNSIMMTGEDGLQNSYQMAIRFNSTTQVQVVTQSRMNLMGIYVR